MTRSSSWSSTVAVAGLILGSAMVVFAQGETVLETRHNLSISGPGEIRAASEERVCIFCHVPHRAPVPEPLWGHSLSKVTDYEVPTIRTGKDTTEPAPQPDGSSRLCLSCHDGTVALGDLGRERRAISMAGYQRLLEGRPGFIGTDLSGSHPVSFVPLAVPPDLPGDVDMGVKSLDLMKSDPDVRLDSEDKIQCTTCHDPHRDIYYRNGLVPRFWIKPTVGEVCWVCHELR